MNSREGKDLLLKKAYLDPESIPVVTLDIATQILEKVSDDAFKAGYETAKQETMTGQKVLV